MKAFLCSLVCLVLAVSGLRAFPPAPYYTLFGTVRDQVGQTLTVEGAMLILLKDGIELGRTPISPVLIDGASYELKVRIDQNRTGTTLYTEKAVQAQGTFSLAVEMNGTFFFPIEVAGTLTAGKGGEMVRLDLTLGEDLDGDGLPDAWEQWQLYQAGYLPDANGQWPINLINKNGDFDGDGLSNFFEYVAGTFAGDATDKFELVIKEKREGRVLFEFYAITGKTYQLERSSDLQTWATIPFAVGTGATDAASYTATEVAIRPASAVSSPTNSREFYRLSVQ